MRVTLTSRVETLEDQMAMLISDFDLLKKGNITDQSKPQCYKKLKIDPRWYCDRVDKLKNVSWNVRHPPENARQIRDDDDDLELKLSQKVFHGPVLLLLPLESRYGEVEWALPINDVTVRGVLQAIHDHIKAYEEACEEGDECEEGVFEGLSFCSTGVWRVDMGS
ncbi:uncharacterized protein ATNIH1004_011638 [Aspergillus tanneri]|uniref:Uncharacterized protein n=1 Tax=Aspergillus tanneri TaxID=1220188 RepID=A0A5M9M387_9EURO|nr:uncharacterized protein ATNIH1004_011638 [Aspergillus tanneri]KAA8641502.1 hypothetical protein ATNIH1004_011638 [Aspergillus tanneri]